MTTSPPTNAQRRRRRDGQRDRPLKKWLQEDHPLLRQLIQQLLPMLMQAAQKYLPLLLAAAVVEDDEPEDDPIGPTLLLSDLDEPPKTA